MSKDHIDKWLDSGLRDQNGKGDRQRNTSKEERKKFEEGWDRIFGKKKKKPPPTTAADGGDGGQSS